MKRQDTVVLWSKSSTLDRMVEGSNPDAANFSFEVDDLNARRKKEDENEKYTFEGKAFSLSLLCVSAQVAPPLSLIEKVPLV